jgi:hypothetical protein
MSRALASARTASSNRVSIQPTNCSLGFNGSSSKVTITGFTPSTTAFGLAMRVKVSNNQPGGNYPRLFSWDNATSGIDFGYNNINNSLFSSIGNGTIFNEIDTPSGAIQPNVWNHVVFNYNGKIQAYINGQASGSSLTATLAAPSSVNPIIGWDSKDNFDYFKGNICQFVFRNGSQFTQSEITALYTQGTIPAGATVVYPLTEGAGTTAYDTSGNANNGTITAGTYTSDTPNKTRGLVGGNLVYNGNFEFAPPTNVACATSSRWLDGTSGGNANSGTNLSGTFGWAYTVNAGSGSSLFDSANPHTGNFGLKVSTTAIASWVFIGGSKNNTAPSVVFNGISVLPSTSYTCTYWMKTTVNSGAATTGAFISVAEANGAGTTGTGNNGTKVNTTVGWTQYSIVFTTGSTTAFLVINPQVKGSDGTATLIMDAWYDDIVLTPTVNTTRSLAV